MSTELRWTGAGISALDAISFHHLLKLRIDVFVVEQVCVYPELDGLDALASTHHVFASNVGGEVVAAARVLAADASGPVRIGRVVVAPVYRGTGLSHELMQRVMRHCDAAHADATIELSAQVGVEKLYERFGFKGVSEVYLDDGIPHRDMRLTR